MASDVVKGGWAPDEDEKLVKGIERFGTRYLHFHNNAMRDKYLTLDASYQVVSCCLCRTDEKQRS
jgi:hypothetical protein